MTVEAPLREFAKGEKAQIRFTYQEPVFQFLREFPNRELVLMLGDRRILAKVDNLYRHGEALPAPLDPALPERFLGSQGQLLKSERGSKGF